MNLNDQLIEWRKGYRHYLKERFYLFGLIEGIFETGQETFLAMTKMLLKIIRLLTTPIWFFPLTYYDYKRKYKYLKKRFADNGIDLTDDYQPKADE